MISAGHLASIQVATSSGGTYNTVGGLNDASLQLSRAILDATHFNPAGQAEASIYGLLSGSISLGGDFDPADTTGQAVLEDALLNGTSVFLKHRPNGTRGWQAEFLVESADFKSSPDGKNEFSVSLKMTGAPTKLP